MIWIKPEEFQNWTKMAEPNQQTSLNIKQIKRVNRWLSEKNKQIQIILGYGICYNHINSHYYH